MTEQAENDGWIKWARSGECPVPKDTLIEIQVLHSDDPPGTEPAKLFSRMAGNSIWDDPRVVAYRAVA